MNFKTICVIGLGYIGLSTAAIFANKKKNVIGVDTNQNIVKLINQGKIHIAEPSLKKIVKTAVKNRYLKAINTPQNADVFLITVQTPLKNNYQPNLSYLIRAIKSLAPILKKGNLLIIESTVPIGTTYKITKILTNMRIDLTFPYNNNDNSDIDIAYCPERVLPGKIINELIKNDRIIGGMSIKSSKRAYELYKIFSQGKCFFTDSKTAEMCKLVENSYRDVNIAFANEISLICAKQKINVWELIKLANHHPRINILQPGPGVGGHCIAIDPWFLILSNIENSKLIYTARLVNNEKINWVAKQVKKLFKKYLKTEKKLANEIIIACFGITFKANIDDIRESPAIKIIKTIITWHKGLIYVVDPNIKNIPISLNKSCKLVSTETAINYADIMLLLVDHKEFKSINNKKIQQQWVIDTKGVWT